MTGFLEERGGWHRLPVLDLSAASVSGPCIGSQLIGMRSFFAPVPLFTFYLLPLTMRVPSDSPRQGPSASLSFASGGSPPLSAPCERWEWEDGWSERQLRRRGATARGTARVGGVQPGPPWEGGEGSRSPAPPPSFIVGCGAGGTTRGAAGAARIAGGGMTRSAYRRDSEHTLRADGGGGWVGWWGARVQTPFSH